MLTRSILLALLFPAVAHAQELPCATYPYSLGDPIGPSQLMAVFNTLRYCVNGLAFEPGPPGPVGPAGATGSPGPPGQSAGNLVSTFAISATPQQAIIPPTANGSWSSSASNATSFHSTTGDIAGNEFAQTLIQYTNQNTSNQQYEVGLVINYTNVSGSISNGLWTSASLSGAGSNWNQANDMIVNGGFTGAVAYNTELDVTNNGCDPTAAGCATSVNDLVLGGFPGINPLASGIVLYEPNPGPNNGYWAHTGIFMGGGFAVKDNTFDDQTSANVSINVQGSHAVGIQMTGTFSQFPIVGTNFSIDNTGHFNTTSDKRLKIARPGKPPGLEALRKIRVHMYSLKSNPKDIDEGFYAQELAKVYPQCVHQGKGDEPWSVDYGCTTPLLIRSVQELDARLSALEKEARLAYKR